MKPVDIKGMVLDTAVPLAGEASNPNDLAASLVGTVFAAKPTVDPEHRRCPLTNFEIVVPATKTTSIRANSTVKLDEGTITLRDDGTDRLVCPGADLDAGLPTQ